MDVKNFIIDFLSVFYEAMPFIVFGALIAGILQELVPQQFFARVVPKNRVLAIALSALLGLIFPMCECGIVPVMRRLLRKGLPLGCCIAYMLAGPIINGIVLWSTWEAFAPHKEKGGYYIIGFRVGLGYAVAVSTALVVQYFLFRKHGNELLTAAAKPDEKSKRTLDIVDESGPAEKKPWTKRVGNISEAALHDFMDITIFLTIGAGLAAMARQTIDMSQVATYSTTYPALAILVMMGLAIIMCLCSEADAFVAASFTNLHPSAKLAFLVLGPMFDIKLFLLFTRVFRPRLIATIIVCVIVFSFIGTITVHYLWEPMGWPSPLRPALPTTR